MRTTENDLAGIRFAYGIEDVPPEYIGTDFEPRYRASLASKQRVIDEAAERGGTMLISSDPVPPSDWPTYRLNRPGISDPEVERRVYEDVTKNRDMGPIPAVRALAMSEVFGNRQLLENVHQRLETGQPFVAALTAGQRGHGKYLIERSAQLEKIQHALAVPQVDTRASQWFELRPFIRTPSDRYTSYRVVVSPVGVILAAALLYSGHTENEERIIKNDRFDDSGAKIRSLKVCLEDPESPYFLASRDIRSNVAAGGSLIPLMGSAEQRAPITRLDADIVAQHRLSNFDGSPNIIAESAAHIGRVCGPEMDICLGIDYAENVRAHSSDNAEAEPAVWFEINVGPAPMPYNDCWLRGEAPQPEANYLQRKEALDSVARLSPRMGTA